MAQHDRPQWDPTMAQALPESPIPIQLRAHGPTVPPPLHPAMGMELIERFFAEIQRRAVLGGLKVNITKDQRGMTIRVEPPTS